MSVKKWQKYEILFRYALSDEADINQQIKRYRKNEIAFLFDDIEQDIACASSSYAYIIKLVPEKLQLKIQNYVVHNFFELQEVKAKILNNSCSFEELWFCKSRYAADNQSVFGRFFINSGYSMDVSQYIEQVWADTARKIESIGKNVQYISATRPWWGWRFHIQSKDFQYAQEMEALRCFEDVTIQLERKRECITQFADDLANLGIYTFDIEYKIIKGTVKIIDWDSPADDFVIGALL